VAPAAVTTPPPAPGAPPEGAAPADTAAARSAARIAGIRAEVDRFLTAQGELLWDAWTRGATPDLEASTASRAALFSRDTLLAVRQARDAAQGDERRALTLLHRFLVGEHLARAAAAALPSPPPPPAVLTWDGALVPTWRVPTLLAAEASGARRAALERAWADAERRQATAVAARWDAIAAAARGLGYDSLLALAAELRGESPDALVRLAEEVLAGTESTYRGLMDGLARAEMRKPLGELRERDVPRLLRAGDDRNAFPAGRGAADARATFSALGLELAARPGIVLDGEARQGKDPRALTLPVSVPGSVRVSYAPPSGAVDVANLLHELGAAAYYAYVDTPVVEFRRLGTVTAEAWAGLFADLVGHPAWLAERTGDTDEHLAPLVRATAARRLHRARTLAVRILDEVARARDPEGAGRTARARLERAVLRPVERDELQLFVADRDPLLESADALRALLLAAQAEQFLAGRGDPAWWRSTANGAWLGAAFAAGSRLAPLELARTLGAERIDSAALTRSTRARAGAAGLRLAHAGSR
jgi:hypothetical protein